MFLVGYKLNEPGKLLFEDLSECDIPNLKKEEKKFIAQKAATLGMTHWALCDYTSYILVEYNVGDIPEVEEFDDDYGYKQSREYASRREYDHVFVIDDGTDVEDLKLPNWKNRQEALSKEEAMKYLASFISSDTGLSKKMIKEAEAFASQWDIPFCGELHNLYVKNWVDCHPAWDSSSRYC